MAVLSRRKITCNSQAVLQEAKLFYESEIFKIYKRQTFFVLIRDDAEFSGMDYNGLISYISNDMKFNIKNIRQVEDNGSIKKCVADLYSSYKGSESPSEQIRYEVSAKLDGKNPEPYIEYYAGNLFRLADMNAFSVIKYVQNK